MVSACSVRSQIRIFLLTRIIVKTKSRIWDSRTHGLCGKSFGDAVKDLKEWKSILQSQNGLLKRIFQKNLTILGNYLHKDILLFLQTKHPTKQNIFTN